MIIGREDIQFSSGEEFYNFVYNNDLYGVVQLREPIVDISGAMLVKDKVALNEGIIRKISNMEGRYISILKALITPGLVDKLAGRIAKEATSIVETKNSFVNQLYEKSPSSGNYKSIIEKACSQPRVSLYLFKILSEKRAFFNHILTNGLLSLGTILQKEEAVKSLHRYTFLAGLFSDICLIDTDYWESPITEGEQINRLCKISSNLIEKLGLSLIIRSALNELNLSALKIDSPHPIFIEPGAIDSESGLLNDMDLFKSLSTEDSDKIDEREYRKFVDSVIESLKISKFIEAFSKRFEGSDNAIELLILSFAYNTEKGYFSKEMGEIMISHFKEYDGLVKKVRKVASIENMCPYEESAWAYPRNEPAQILCRKKVYECKNVETGWDICIVSEKEAYGYLGTNLLPGIYPKCALESQLEEIHDNRVKPKLERKLKNLSPKS